jgi:hypothetical protein
VKEDREWEGKGRGGQGMGLGTDVYRIKKRKARKGVIIGRDIRCDIVIGESS